MSRFPLLLFTAPACILATSLCAATITETKLTPSDGAVHDNFGYSVAISGNTAIVGVIGDDDNVSQSGSAYLFDATTGQQIAKLTAEDGAAYDSFGHSVAISGNTAIVGAFGEDDKGSSSGSAYVYSTNDVAPVPLPAGVWLLGSAVGLITVMRRRG